MDEAATTNPGIKGSNNGRISSHIKYGIFGKGWHTGTLVLENDTVSLQSDNNQIIFNVSIKDISKVSARNTIGFGIYLNGDKKRYAISFDSPYAGAVGAAGIGAYVSAAQKAQPLEQPWIDYFKSRGIYKEELGYGHRVKPIKVVVYVAIAICVFILLSALVQYLNGSL